MTQFSNPIKPITDSQFGQLVIQSALVSASTAIRLAGVTLFGIALIKISDIATRCLSEAPYVGWIAEKINPALYVSRADRYVNRKCEEAVFFVSGKCKWHAVDESEKEVALKHIANQQYKATGEVNAYPKGSRGDKVVIEPKIINRMLMISSFCKALLAVIAATCLVRPVLTSAEYISPGIQTWNAVSDALRIPVKVIL